jgi:protein-S-isoprenylcysteine O-methyltransferase
MDVDLILYMIFAFPCAFIELYISTTKYSSSSDKSLSNDRRTFESIWIVISMSQMFTIYCICQGYGMKIIDESQWKTFVWIPLSIGLYFLGHLLRKQAIEQLGVWFTTIVRTNKHQPLIDAGWYSRMRHPSYTGVLMYFLAITLLLNNWLGIVGIIVPVCFVFAYRIYIEEQVLRKHFGIKHEQYCDKVPNRIMPKIFS